MLSIKEKIYSDSKWKILINDRYTTISSHIFLPYVCSSFKKLWFKWSLWGTGLNLEWFKSCGLRCNLRLRGLSASSQKIEPHKWPFYDHFWPFFCQLYGYLSQNWGSDGHFEVLKKSKSQLVQNLWHKTQMSILVQNCKKPEMELFAFCIITHEPIRI